MNQQIEQDEIKPLIYNYIFHIVLFIIYLALHIIIQIYTYWVIKSFDTIFLLGTYFNILYLAFPIFPLIIIFKRLYKKNIIYIVKMMTLILLIITLIFGLILFVIFLINAIKSKLFCKECPFNLGLDHLNKVFGPYYGKGRDNDDLKDLCISRRCVLDHVNYYDDYPYSYLCNYDPSDEFDDDETLVREKPNGYKVSVNKQLTCQPVYPNYNSILFTHSELISYLDLCYYYSDFYRCKRFNKPKNYNLDLDEECPESNYLLLVYIMCVIIVVMDIIISLLPWGIEYITFKKILIYLSTNRRKTDSHNSTARSSEISQEDESFKKEKTPVLIHPLEDENLDNEQKIETDSNLVYNLKNKTIQVNQLKINVIPEDEKDIYKPIKADKIISSDRVKLNLINNDIETKINQQTTKINTENMIRTRNKKENNHQDNTKLNATNVKPIEIKIDVNNDPDN